MGPPIRFFPFCLDSAGGAFLMCFANKSVRRGQISDKNKIGWGRSLEAWWGRFWPVAFILGLFGSGWGGAGLLLGTSVFAVVALWFWCVLRSACAFPAGFGWAWSGVWPGLAQAPVCCLGRRSEFRSSLDDLPSKHDKCVFSPNGPKGVSGWPPIPIFFEVFSTIPN